MSDFKKEFYSLDFNNSTIGMVMMVKNESKRIEVIIYDTGSEDDTIEIIKKILRKK